MVQNNPSLQNSKMFKNKTKGVYIRKLSWQDGDGFLTKQCESKPNRTKIS